MANTGNIQQIIDYGVTANDGTGDPLRTAFIKTDENFSNIWLAGPVGSNITIGNNTVQVNDTNGNLVLKPNGIGVVQVNASIVPDSTQLRDLGTANNRFRSIYVSSNLDLGGNLSAGNLTVTDSVSLEGDITVDGNLTVNGTTLTVNVATLDIADKNIVIANGSPNAQSANGSGITVEGANAQLTYISATDSWNSNKALISDKIETNVVKTQPTTVSSLLLANTAGAGSRAMVTDADSRTWGNLLVGGAGNTVPVWSDGADWYIG